MGKRKGGRKRGREGEKERREEVAGSSTIMTISKSSESGAAVGISTKKLKEGGREQWEGEKEGFKSEGISREGASVTTSSSSNSCSRVQLLDRKHKQAVARAEEARARRMEKEMEKAMRDEPEVSPVVLDREGRQIWMEGGDFVTGLVGLNRIASRVGELSDEEKRKILFGSDQLVP